MKQSFNVAIMKVAESIKSEIRCFVYFLFSGSLDQRLISARYDYLELLLKNPQYVFNCFKIFTHYLAIDSKDYTTKVADYIIALHEKSCNADMLIESVLINHKAFWICFLKFSESFCFNTFQTTIQNFNLPHFQGNGTDALSGFIIWTNVIEVDRQQNVLNSGYATKRAYERLKFLFDNVAPAIPFSEQEYDAEFY